MVTSNDPAAPKSLTAGNAVAQDPLLPSIGPIAWASVGGLAEPSPESSPEAGDEPSSQFDDMVASSPGTDASSEMPGEPDPSAEPPELPLPGEPGFPSAGMSPLLELRPQAAASTTSHRPGGTTDERANPRSAIVHLGPKQTSDRRDPGAPDIEHVSL